jgi:hypothetical protein
MLQSTALLMLQYYFLLVLIKHVFLDGRSDGASTSNVRRGRQKSMSTAPEIGDDFARLVKMI